MGRNSCNGSYLIIPQAIDKFGTYVVRATEKDEADRLVEITSA